MARFTGHGGLRVLFSGDITSFGCESRDPIRLRTGGGRRFLERPFGIPRNIRGVRYHRHGGRVCSVGMDSSSLGAEESLDGDDGGDEGREEGEFESDELSSFRGLVLDISYRPVNVVCWKRAICLEFMEKADVLEYYDQTVSSPSGSFYIPAVLRVPQLLQVVKRRRTKHNLSRKRIFFRDAFTCQYCSSHENLTVDHVIPISRGGQWRWENLVTACARCNSRKGQKTLEETNMKLIKTPKAPKDYDIVAIPLTKSALKMLKTSKRVPQEWLQYLSKPAP